MIFSKLFKPKWQHKDANVRIAAINEELSVEDTEQYQILLSLVDSDDSELVRRAALLKLNSFTNWLLASTANSNRKIQEYAYAQVLQILQNKHTLRLTTQEKKDYLSEHSHISIMEAWLQSETDPELIIALYNKIGKPQLLQTLFIQKQITQVQTYFIELTDDKNLLEKLLKKSVDETVSQLITSKLESIHTLEQKPKIIRKQVQLLLSKLLALKDVSNYESMIAKKDELVSEWSEVENDIHTYLPEEEAAFTDKYQSIDEQLTKLFATKAEQYQQLEIERELSRQKLAVSSELDKAITVISQSLATAIYESNTVDEAAYKDKFAQLSDVVKNSVLNEAEKKQYLNSINNQERKLAQLPAIAESVTAATHLISKMSQLATPSNLEELKERLPLYDSWRLQWSEVEKTAEGVLPDSIVDAYKEITRQWKKALQPLFSQQKDLFNQTQKKFGELKRLIASGKYNASFGVYKKVQHLFEQLAEHQQGKLQREYDVLSEKMAELSDWEHYIATPRKQELLKEVEQIVTQPLDNPNEQAQKVKQFRKTWNSLGHADDELDKALNEQFNQLCEDAFAPCRIYYAEQDKLRELHLSVRLAVIDDAKNLVNQTDLADVDWKSLDGQLNQLNQRWQDAGEVDRSKYRELNQQYIQIIKPLKSAIKSFHDDNVQIKKELINNAELALSNEDVYAAIETVKSLQTKWRLVGYAGPREENKLWQNFRAINDRIFKKREEMKAQEQTQRTQQQFEFEKQLVDLKQNYSIECSEAELNELKESANNLRAEIVSTKPVIKSAIQAVESFTAELEELGKKKEQQKSKQSWQLVFSLLEKLSAGDMHSDEIKSSNEFLQLSGFWQKKLQETSIKKRTDKRLEKTLEIEIQAGIDSPQEFTQQRLAVQVSLMQEKMVSGAKVDLQEAFLSWLRVGPIVSEDKELVKRIKPIFCNE